MSEAPIENATTSFDGLEIPPFRGITSRMILDGLTQNVKNTLDPSFAVVTI
jgi:hypothetical protein